MTLKNINFDVAMYGTAPINQSTYEMGYTGDEASINVKFTITDEADLAGATAIVHLYFADSHHIVRNLTLTGSVFNYTLVGTENDHAGVVRADIIITKGGAKFTRAGHKFRIDTSLEASKPLVEYVVDTLDTLVDGAEGWLLQAQTDFGTAQGTRAAEWIADNDTRADEFTAAQASRATTFGASETARTSTFNTNETGRSNTFTTNENARQAAAEANQAQAATDHTTASADHTTAVADSSLASSDHGTAVADHSTAVVDHSTASADHTAALADQGIVDGLQDQFDAVIANATVDSEVINARQGSATLSQNLLSIKSELADIDSQVDLLNRGLGETFATLVALQTAYPTGDTKDHIVGADGHRYFWSGTAWADGGAYQARENADESILPFAINGEATEFKKTYPTVSNTVLDQYVNSDGIIKSDVTIFDYFKVFLQPNTQYKIKTYSSLGAIAAEFDSTNTPIATYTIWNGHSPVDGFITITTQATVSYIIININPAEGETYIQQPGLVKKELKWLDISSANSKWYGKKAVMIGDSITAGADGATSGTSAVADAYKIPNLLKAKLGLSACVNYGSAGTTIATTFSGDNGMGAISFVRRYPSMDNDADLVIVFGGTNDYGVAYTVPFGVISDTSENTFYGAMNTLCSGLVNKYIGKTIVFMTPIHRTGGYTPNAIGKTLVDYVNAEKEVCEKWGIPVIDTYNISGFTADVVAFKNAYLPDGLHPNATGYPLFVDRFYKNFELI